jgi:hypothetical protein
MTSSQRIPVTLAMNDTKTAPSHLEEYADDISKDSQHADDGHLVLPAALQGLSEEEFKSVARKATWKVTISST